jgi:hypothetical protein
MSQEPQKYTISVPTSPKSFDKSIIEDISWAYDSFHSHRDVVATLAGKHPYTVTILIELLSYKNRNRKKYVQKTIVPMVPKYRQLLFEMFFKEYGQNGGNELFGKWLDQYRPLFTDEQREQDYNVVDEYIIEHELEPRYKQRILARFRNHEKLFQERHRIERKRYYNLPDPFQHVDWRNSFDNIFVWEENGQKVARRGGSGASGSREMNSMFIFGLLELSKTEPVPSYVLVYSENNELLFVKKFDSLCVPAYDVGSNYHELSHDEITELTHGGLFLDWDPISKISEIEVVRK